jgi:hypothetical protein
MMTSPPHPSTVQRELVEPVDPNNPVDIPRDITVGRERFVWAHQTLQEEEGHASHVVLFERAMLRFNKKILVKIMHLH